MANEVKIARHHENKAKDYQNKSKYRQIKYNAIGNTINLNNIKLFKSNTTELK